MGVWVVLGAVWGVESTVRGRESSSLRQSNCGTHNTCAMWEAILELS